MTDPFVWTLCFLGGIALGAAYMALLALAVRRLLHRQATGQFIALALLRAGLVMGGLGLAILLGAGAIGLLSGLAGFIAARLAATRLGEAAPWR